MVEPAIAGLMRDVTHGHVGEASDVLEGEKRESKCVRMKQREGGKGAVERSMLDAYKIETPARTWTSKSGDPDELWTNQDTNDQVNSTWAII